MSSSSSSNSNELTKVSAMDPIPNEEETKAGLIQKHIADLTELKRQVLHKRYELRALGARDDTVSIREIVRADRRKEIEAGLDSKEIAKKTKADKTKVEKAASVSAPPAESPFIDPNAPKVQIQTSKPSEPIPVPVPAQIQAPQVPPINKPADKPVQVQAAVKAQASKAQTAVRLGHGAKWF